MEDAGEQTSRNATRVAGAGMEEGGRAIQQTSNTVIGHKNREIGGRSRGFGQQKNSIHLGNSPNSAIDNCT